MSDGFERLLTERGVLLAGHFRLASGRHSGQYFEKFRILEQPEVCGRFAARVAERFRDAGITAVCGPTTGGVIIAYEVARRLGCRCVIAEKDNEHPHPSLPLKGEGMEGRGLPGRKIGRGFRLGPDDNVLVVDDVMTTGGSLVETLAALEPSGCRVAGVAVFIDRSGGRHRLDRDVFSVFSQDVVTWPADECPLCRQGVELVEPGQSRRV